MLCSYELSRNCYGGGIDDEVDTIMVTMVMLFTGGAGLCFSNKLKNKQTTETKRHVNAHFVGHGGLYWAHTLRRTGAGGSGGHAHVRQM